MKKSVIKKHIFLGILLILIIAMDVFANDYLKHSSTVILINEELIDFKNPIYTVNDLTYVPLRELSEKLRIPINWNGNKQQVTLDLNKKTVRYSKSIEANRCLENGVIPDAQTAKKVAKSILEGCTGRQAEYIDGDYEYYLSVSFWKPTNCWEITQLAKYKGEFFGGGNVSPHIVINKSTGEVISINLHPAWDDIRKVHQDKH